MKVQTKPYGLIDVDERQLISFPTGIFGFETLKRYVLLDAIQQPFYWLQSIDVPEIAFVLISPFIFVPITILFFRAMSTMRLGLKEAMTMIYCFSPSLPYHRTITAV